MSSTPSPTQNVMDTWRISSFQVVLVLIFIGFIFRLFQLQVLQGQDFSSEAVANRTNEASLPAPRGNIYDRNGIILATNIPSYNVVVTASQLPDDLGDIQDVYRKLSVLIDMPINLGEISPETPYSPCVSEHGIAQIAVYGETTTPFRPVRLKCDIDAQLARVIMEKTSDLPGIGVEIETVRDYPTGDLTAAVIGFLGPIPADRAEEFEGQGFDPNRDKVGYAGLEYQYQEELAGKNGLRVFENDVAGQVIRVMEQTPATPGLNLQLTIDMRLQEAADAIVRSELEGWNTFLGRILSTNAVAIAMNPQTGEILAMVSVPTYENNRFARAVPPYYYQQLISDLAKPFLNHAISAEHPPGSVFKLSTAVGGLNEGVIEPGQIIKTPGKITVAEKFFTADFGNTREFVDWIYRNGQNPGGFGELDIIGCIQNSSNVCFYKVGGGFGDEIPDGLGICRLKAYANALGYGDASGIELPGEQTGLLPDPRWKRINQGENWSTGDTYIASVGQGYVLSTPLQVLESAATIANDGKRMRPTIIREIIDGEGNVIKDFQPEMLYNLTLDPVVTEYIQYVAGSGGCQESGNKITIQPWVFETVKQGMRQAVLRGTLEDQFANFTIAAAGKTGTAEYCDPFAQEKNLCEPGNWPTHAWTTAFAPFDNPEIAVVAFVYNGGEGASVAGPIVEKILKAYFEIKALELDT